MEGGSVSPPTEFRGSVQVPLGRATTSSEPSRPMTQLGGIPELNILILGETGVGKSTFINAFVNYIHYQSIDDPLSSKELQCVIPSSFTWTSRSGNDFIAKTIHVDPTGDYADSPSRESAGDETKGESTTTCAKTYTVQVGVTTIRLIDTPGFGDVRGSSQDRKSMDDILAKLRTVGVLHAILILLKPNSARLTAMYRFCLKELLTNLYHDAAKNIVFGFTNARNTSFRPGETYEVLKRMLDADKSVGIQLGRDTAYCFDAESFRCLAAHNNDVDIYEMGNIQDYRLSWDKSVAELHRMLKHLRPTLTAPHLATDTWDLFRAREIVRVLTIPMADIIQTVNNNIALQKDEQRSLNDALAKGETSEIALHITQKVYDVVPLDRPRTVCSSAECIESTVEEVNYTTRCHDPCYLDHIEVDKVSPEGLKRCYAFSQGTDGCVECGHPWMVHLHVMWERLESTVQVEDQAVMQRMNEDQEYVEVMQEALSSRQKLIEGYETERSIIQQAAAQFAVFLKRSSIKSWNDTKLAYLDHLMCEERDKIEAGGSDKRIKDLGADRAQHEQKIRILTDHLKRGESHKLLDPEGIQNLIEELYSLKLTGPKLRQGAKLLEDIQNGHIEKSKVQSSIPTYPHSSSRGYSKGRQNAQSFQQSAEFNNRGQSQQQGRGVSGFLKGALSGSDDPLVQTMLAPTSHTQPSSTHRDYTVATVPGGGSYSADASLRRQAMSEDTTATGDNDTDSIETNPEKLSEKEKLTLANIFVSELRKGLDDILKSNECDHNARSRILVALPELLKSYARNVAQRAQLAFEQQAAIFVRDKRMTIVSLFGDTLHAMPIPGDGPDAQQDIDDMASLDKTSATFCDEDEPEDLSTITLTRDDINAPVLERELWIQDKSERVDDSNRMRLAHDFMVEEGSDFDWLLNQLRTSVGVRSTSTFQTHVRNVMIEKAGTKSEFSLELDWDPIQFIAEQYEATECRLQQVICLCGEGDSIQAISCQDYTSRNWPEFGMEMLQLLSDASTAGYGIYQHAGGFGNVEINLLGTKTFVNIRGDTATIVEGSTYFVWLGAAIRASPWDEKPAYCTPTFYNNGRCDCKISYTFNQLPDIEGSALDDASCWQSMFRNPVIAKGYPTSPRLLGEHGLEVSLDMMTELAQAPVAMCFRGSTFIKGFSTILVLAKRIGISCVWHFLINRHGKRISYNIGLRFAAPQTELGESDLRTARHFVGWTLEADVLAVANYITSAGCTEVEVVGSSDANYDIKPTGQYPGRPHLVSIGSISTGFSKVLALNVTFVPGKKDIAPSLHDSRPYDLRIVATAEWNVLFYDVVAKRAWLLDGPSALLHICRAWLSSTQVKLLDPPQDPVKAFQHVRSNGGMKEALRLLRCDANRDIQIFPMKLKSTVESSTDLQTNSLEVKRKAVGSWYTWESVVDERFFALELLHDHLIEKHHSRSGRARLPFQKRLLEGYDFQEFMKGCTKLQTWEAQFQSSWGGWLEFILSINAVPIFGSDFGDLIQPAQTSYGGSRLICGRHMRCPTGRDYLAVTTAVLEPLCRESLRQQTHDELGSGCIRLGPSTYWVNPNTVSAPCNCGRNACEISIAKMAESTAGTNRKTRSTDFEKLFSQNAKGAIIFGCGSNRLSKPQHDYDPKEISGQPSIHSVVGAGADSNISSAALTRRDEYGSTKAEDVQHMKQPLDLQQIPRSVD